MGKRSDGMLPQAAIDSRIGAQTLVAKNPAEAGSSIEVSSAESASAHSQRRQTSVARIAAKASSNNSNADNSDDGNSGDDGRNGDGDDSRLVSQAVIHWNRL